MKSVPLAIQTLFAELEQRVHDADFAEQFDTRGRFRKKRRHNKSYWYFTYRDGAKVMDKYVGPVADEKIGDRVKRFEDLTHDFDQRRQLVRLLHSAGLPATDHSSGDVTAALARAGFFRMQGVLIGTTAYECYAGMLGIRLPAAAIRTQDAEFAQYYAIANQIDDAVPSMLDALRKVDTTFAPVPHIAGGLATTAFVNKDHYKIEFLTPNRGSDDFAAKPAAMPTLRGASAEPLRFLDFLIRHPVRSVLLHEAGVPVTVPAPARYAIHKLIVAVRRAEVSTMVDKDVARTAFLIEAMWEKRSVDLSEAWQEAWERGPTWRQALTDGLSRLEREVAQKLETAVKAGASRRRTSVQWP